MIFSASVSAESPQSYCDTEASNAQKMYGDLISVEFQTGQITYEQLAENYGRQTTAFTSNLNLQLLKTIYEKRAQVSQGDVVNWIYKRCVADYNDYQQWWAVNSRGRASDYLAPRMY